MPLIEFDQNHIILIIIIIFILVIAILVSSALYQISDTTIKNYLVGATILAWINFIAILILLIYMIFHDKETTIHFQAFYVVVIVICILTLIQTCLLAFAINGSTEIIKNNSVYSYIIESFTMSVFSFIALLLYMGAKYSINRRGIHEKNKQRENYHEFKKALLTATSKGGTEKLQNIHAVVKHNTHQDPENDMKQLSDYLTNISKFNKT